MSSINHRIAPRNAHEEKVIEACELGFKILCEKLNLPNLIFTVQRQAGWAGSDAWHAGMFSYKMAENTRTVKINLRNLEGQSIETVITILGHEMRHAYQNAHGMTRSVCEKMYENVPTIKTAGVGAEHFERWFNRAEEQDAMAFENAYAQLVFDDPRFEKFQSYLTQTDGEIPLIEDALATKAKYHRDNDELFKFVFSRDRLNKEVFYLYASQFGNFKKITKKVRMTAFTEHRELLQSQKIEPVLRPLNIRDLCC